MTVGTSEPASRSFPTLDSLAAAAKSSFCEPEIVGYCPEKAATLSALDRQIVLTYRDSLSIARLFLLRPPTIRVSRSTPSDSLPIVETVRVEYIAPELPMPNAATYIEAERARQAHKRSIHWITRYIGGGPRFGGPLWVELGDSAMTGIGELRCMSDVCFDPGFEGAITWSVDDTSVVTPRVTPDSVTTPSGDIRIRMPRASKLALIGRRIGRTTLRAQLGPSYSDTMPSRTPPLRSLVREVQVIPRIARVELTVSRRVIYVGQTVEFRVRVLDTSGRRLRVPIDMVFVNEFGTLGETNERIPHEFSKAGPATVIARFGNRVESLHLDIRPRSPRQ